MAIHPNDLCLLTGQPFTHFHAEVREGSRQVRRHLYGRLVSPGDELGAALTQDPQWRRSLDRFHPEHQRLKKIHRDWPAALRIGLEIGKPGGEFWAEPLTAARFAELTSEPAAQPSPRPRARATSRSSR